MDELTYVERLRAEVPEPTDLTAVEARFNAGMAEPAAGPRRGWWFGPNGAGPRHTSRALLIGGLATAVTAGALVAVSLGGDGSTRPPAPGPGTRPGPVTGSGEPVRVASVTVLMARAASAAKARPMPKPRPDQYIYRETQAMNPADSAGRAHDNEAWLSRYHRHEWLSVDGSRPDLIRQRDLEPKKIPGYEVPSVPDRGNNWEMVSEPCGARPPLERAYIDNLPTDPEMLLELIDKDSGEGDRGARLWEHVSGMLITAAVSPESSGVLYQAIARIPDVRLVDDSVDAAGRHGIAVARVERGTRMELIFDKKTYQFLGQREVVVKAGGPAPLGPVGTLVTSTAVLRTSVVDNMPRPSPAAEPSEC
jgi:hypothetical protein